MKFVYRNSFDGIYDDLLETKDALYTVNLFHLCRRNPETFAVEEDHPDFLCPHQMVATPDEHYLITEAPSVGYSLYDLTKKPLEGKPHLFKEMEKHPLSMAFSKDSQYLYVIYAGKLPESVQLFSGDDPYEKALDLKLVRYALPNLDTFDIIDSQQPFIRIRMLPYLDALLLVSQDLDLYLLKDKKITPLPLPKLTYDMTSIVVDEKRRHLIIQDRFGVRIYDEEFQEINKIDFISDDKENVSSDLYHFANEMKVNLLNPDSSEISVYKQQILEVLPFEKDYLLIHAADALQENSTLMLVSLETGKLMATFPFGRIIEGLMTAGKFVSFSSARETILLEVTHD